jgi:hypothetical protein
MCATWQRMPMETRSGSRLGSVREAFVQHRCSSRGGRLTIQRVRVRLLRSCGIASTLRRIRDDFQARWTTG